jgi:hypothetical protein
LKPKKKELTSMTHNDLSRALLNLDSQTLSGLTDAREQTWRIIEQDRRRVWWWSATTIALWAAATLMVLAMLVAYALVFPLQAKLRQDAEVARIGLSAEQKETAQFKAQIMFQMVTVGVTVSVGLTCLAILSSVLLNRASRRATLRQINASLLEISQQLKELQQQAAKPSA